MKYIYGNPNAHPWKNVASIFAAHDSLNSAQTSSLPLVQFWRASGKNFEGKQLNPDAQELLEKCLGEKGTYKGAQLCFEYAVPVYTNSGRGKASMTDLMILTEKHTIALEAKWTECDTDCQMIDNWLGTKLEKGDSKANREKVLNGWIKYINEYLSNTNMTINGISLKKDDYQIIPYQLLHRIASACAVANERNTDANERKTDAIVIYQLFYNENNGDLKEITEKKVQTFANKLNEGYAKLFGKEKPIQFCIMKTKVTKGEGFDTAMAKCKKSGDLNELFLEMQHRDIYSFDWEPYKP